MNVLASMHSPVFWYIARLLSLALLLLGIVLVWLLFFPKQPAMGLLAFSITLILHLPQLPNAIKIAHSIHYSKYWMIWGTIFCGATWWMPLKNQVFKS